MFKCVPAKSSVHVTPREYHLVKNALNDYARCTLGLTEMPPVPTLELARLAACEDPDTIVGVKLPKNDVVGGDEVEDFPLPQTGQMAMEYLLLRYPYHRGFYTNTVSWRSEMHPTPGRHRRQFNMFEMEWWTSLNGMIDTQSDMFKKLGLKPPSSEALANMPKAFLPRTVGGFPEARYLDIAKHYDVKVLENEHEKALYDDFGSPVFFITHFPDYSNPYWNMKASTDEEGIMLKTDGILCGIESTGGAEREVDPNMYKRFLTQSDGQYRVKLYEKAGGKEAIDSEVADYLDVVKEYNARTDVLGNRPRSGFGSGLERIVRALKVSKVITADVGQYDYPRALYVGK